MSNVDTRHLTSRPPVRTVPLTAGSISFGPSAFRGEALIRTDRTEQRATEAQLTELIEAAVGFLHRMRSDRIRRAEEERRP